MPAGSRASPEGDQLAPVGDRSRLALVGDEHHAMGKLIPRQSFVLLTQFHDLACNLGDDPNAPVLGFSRLGLASLSRRDGPRQMLIEPWG
jgi:hypothetical protein